MRIVRRWLATMGCRLLCSAGLGALMRSLLMSKNTCMAGSYPRSYSQVLCRASQHWGFAGGSIVALVSAYG